MQAEDDVARLHEVEKLLAALAAALAGRHAKRRSCRRCGSAPAGRSGTAEACWLLAEDTLARPAWPGQVASELRGTAGATTTAQPREETRQTTSTCMKGALLNHGWPKL